MYSIGPRDRVVSADEIPPPSGGPAQPLAIVDENEARLLYYLAESWRVDQRLTGEQRLAICRFKGLAAVYWGAPNDEALPNHPLYQRGLGYYGAFRVERCSWAAAQSELSWRKDAPPRNLPERTHWIITMKDSTFECIAETATVVLHTGTIENAILALRPRGKPRSLG